MSFARKKLSSRFLRLISFLITRISRCLVPYFHSITLPIHESFVHISSFSVPNVFTFYLIFLSNRTHETCSGSRYCHDLARCLLRDVYRLGWEFYSPYLLSVGYMCSELHSTTMVSCVGQKLCLYSGRLGRCAHTTPPSPSPTKSLGTRNLNKLEGGFSYIAGVYIIQDQHLLSAT